MMSRLEAVVQHYGITIETPILSKSLEGMRVRSATPFTLSFQGRSLRDKIHVSSTITPLEALTTLFVLADASRRDKQFRSMSARYKRKLRQFLGGCSEEFWNAFLLDDQEQLERQQAVAKASFAAASKEKSFEVGERVRYVGDSKYVYCTVIREMWRGGQFQGILVKREEDGMEIALRTQYLSKEN